MSGMGHPTLPRHAAGFTVAISGTSCANGRLGIFARVTSGVGGAGIAQPLTRAAGPASKERWAMPVP